MSLIYRISFLAGSMGCTLAGVFLSPWAFLGALVCSTSLICLVLFAKAEDPRFSDLVNENRELSAKIKAIASRQETLEHKIGFGRLRG